MKNRLALLLMALVLAFTTVKAADFVNLTPAPAEMTVGTGELVLTRGMKVGYSSKLPADMVKEVKKFTDALNAATDLGASAVKGKGLLSVELDKSIPEEGYALDVTTTGAVLKASTAAGLYYGFQTVKKILPVNVMAGVKAAVPTVYALPVVAINDAPRYPYRGYMLDVSRHFFDVDQVKKMLDVMAMYKMNRFHWHLTDDHGWRMPMDKYPELTEKGATNRNILRSDYSEQRQWRDGHDKTYGPFAYTKDEIKDIVEYARERHIEVIPEVDMPGHMVAAVHTYPQFSTDPQSKIAVGFPKDMEPVAYQANTHFTHNIWNVGGVSRDVLDISNPEVMQFTMDVIDQLAEYFPSEYIHIGGDECPTDAWAKSDSCQAMKQRLGLKSDRALQSWFTKQIADYAASKHGKKLMGWNELITDEDPDMDLVNAINPVIFCWVAADYAAKVAQENGLQHIYTPHDRGYYINRSYKNKDRIGAVRDGSLDLSYNSNPPETDLCIGVQGSFWTEQVDRREDLEYLTLPRLQAIAEHGWTPADKKDYQDFLRRMRADESLLHKAGYNYARHQLEE